nr:uncharacterized protein LOC113742372 [Coffea arabica]
MGYRSKKSQRDGLLHSISLESHQPFLLRRPNVHSILPANSNDTETSMNMSFRFAALEPSSIAYNKEDHLTLEPDISQMHCMHETEQIEAENASCSRFVTYPIESGMPHPVNPATLLFASSNMVHSIVNAPSELLATKNPVAANNRRQRSEILKHKRCQEKKTSKSSPAKPQLPLPSVVVIPAVDTVQSESIQYESTDIFSLSIIARTPKIGREVLNHIPTAADLLPRQRNCPHCSAKKFAHETANFCCSNGDVILASNSIPTVLKELLTSSSEEAQLFRTCIRTINNTFAFTSFGVKCDKNLAKRNKGIYTFKVQGQVYHFINDLETSKNLQFYFHDSENELANRLDAYPRLTESILQKTMNLMQQNPYARFFRGLREVHNLDTYRIVLRTHPGLDQRVFNKPTVSQVAALWVEGEENGETSRRDIRVYTHGGHSHNIQYYYGCYDPLQYPLLLPFGESGWHQGIKKQGKNVHKKKTRKRDAQISISPMNASTAEELIQMEQDLMAGIDGDPDFVSIREYYAYKLQMRNDDESFLLHFGRLFQQYVVDIAEIPDKTKYPHLYRMVKKHMMHGPCGVLNPSKVCMTKHGCCKNSYPKEFSEQTIQTLDSYPKYRRRNNGVKIKVRKQKLDNTWVVPHNAYLLAKFNCHINVEICSTIQAVKYIYKYICKGHDRISFHINSDNPNNQIDEIQQYQAARWVSPPEAVWRLFRFSMGEIKPAIIHLQLHLPNFQPIHFKKHENLNNIVKNPRNRKTMLTEFFYMNRTDSVAQELNCTYAQFPDHFVWLADEKRWKIRDRGDSIGRINTAHPSEGERYYLRLLLSKVRAPKSFEDLMTHNGVQVTTFREAALLRGLLEDDNSQEFCLQEASLFHMPYEMRRLFATLLVYSSSNDPKQLWTKFESVMSEDFMRNTELSPREIKRKVLEQINGFLQSMGKNIASFGLLPNNFSFSDVDNQTRDVLAEKSIRVLEEDLNAISLLNQNQRHAFEAISKRVYENKSGAFFVDGPGGTGKSFLYRALLADIRSKGYIALATATSGIAASILPGGRTAHSRFKIPIDTSEGRACKISKQSSLASMIKECKLIIWDEAPMCKRSAIEALNDFLRDLMNSDKIFGGKVIVLGGDFRQTLPVVRKGSQSETIAASLINSPIWPALEKLELTQNMRARFDPSFTDYLLRVGDGTNQAEDDSLIHLPSSILVSNGSQNASLHDLIDVVYPHIHYRSENPALPLNRAILTTKNHFVDEVNDILIDKFPGTAVEYLSFDRALNPNNQVQYEDFLNSLSPSGLPPYKLILKPGVPVILLRNLDPTEGLCNGTRLICKSLSKHVIHAQIAVGDFAGKDVFIHRIPLQPPTDEQYPIPYTRTQFPIRLCFAMTINKAQGQTLDYVGIYLKEPVFSHGQLYVALSRARTASQVKVLIKPPFFDKPRTDQAKNIVFREVLETSRIAAK